MINTHYIYRPPTLDPDEFSAFAADVKRIIDAAPLTVSLAGEDGSEDPEVTPRRIALNGDASRGSDHEPLVIEQRFTRKPPDRARNGVFFDFCKTHGKPYDLIVVAVLYAFIHHFPNCKFVSDSKEDELQPGFDLFTKAVRPHCDAESLRLRPIRDAES